MEILITYTFLFNSHKEMLHLKNLIVLKICIQISPIFCYSLLKINVSCNKTKDRYYIIYIHKKEGKDINTNK